MDDQLDDSIKKEQKSEHDDTTELRCFDSYPSNRRLSFSVKYIISAMACSAIASSARSCICCDQKMQETD